MLRTRHLVSPDMWLDLGRYLKPLKEYAHIYVHAFFFGEVKLSTNFQRDLRPFCLAPRFLCGYRPLVIQWEGEFRVSYTCYWSIKPMVGVLIHFFFALTCLLNIWYKMEIIFSTVILNLVTEKWPFSSIPHPFYNPRKCSLQHRELCFLGLSERMIVKFCLNLLLPQRVLGEKENIFKLLHSFLNIPIYDNWWENVPFCEIKKK